MMPSRLRAALAMSLPAAVLLSAAAFAQASAPGAVPPPPPPPNRAPPPPGGPSVILDHNGSLIHVDVHCAPPETTRACIDLATQLYGKLNGNVQAK